MKADLAKIGLTNPGNNKPYNHLRLEHITEAKYVVKLIIVINVLNL